MALNVLKTDCGRNPEHGFILMMMLVLMVLGAAVYYGNYAKNYGFWHRTEAGQKTISQLNGIKQQYANGVRALFVDNFT